MSIQSIDEQGNLQWRCFHGSEDSTEPCGAVNSAHISHENIQWVGLPGAKPEHHLVALPVCQDCGVQTFLKVHFSDKELMTANMWQSWNDWHEERLQELQQMYAQAKEGTTQKEALAEQLLQIMQVKQAGGMHTPSHATALRHQELARQLIISGKTVPMGA